VAFGARLKRAVGERSYTSVAREVGVKPHTFWGYVNGVSLPSFDVLVRIADFLDVTLDWLIRGKEAPAVMPYDAETLQGVVAALEEHMAGEKIKLKPGKKAEVVALLYEDIMEAEEPKPEIRGRVIKFTKLAS
jgi:transcriptional regulator with XRE-family HTH domain